MFGIFLNLWSWELQPLTKLPPIISKPPVWLLIFSSFLLRVVEIMKALEECPLNLAKKLYERWLGPGLLMIVTELCPCYSEWKLLYFGKTSYCGCRANSMWQFCLGLKERAAIPSTFTKCWNSCSGHKQLEWTLHVSNLYWKFWWKCFFLLEVSFRGI